MAKVKKEQGSVSSAATAFSAIDKKLWLPGSGCSGALDYMEQSSWLLFLRYLDAHEEERRLEAAMIGNVYEPALPKNLRWSTWAYPTNADGKLDVDAILKGDELIFFVQHTLFPGLRRLKENAESTDSINYYQLDLKGVSLGKTRPLNEKDLAEFEALYRSSPSPSSSPSYWTVDPATLDETTLDLSVNNPNVVEEKLPSAEELKAKIKAIYAEIGKLVEAL